MIRRLILASVLLSGCSTNGGDVGHDLIKAIERGAYDQAAEILSNYCQGVYDKGLWVQRTRIEVRREIRQSDKGRYGPAGPSEPVPGLDEKTAQGTGPVIQIWCEGETVPDDIWVGLVRDWKD